ncbi:putative DNA modification/repair radical SAM protein [uncultured Oscillibacter sp.]|uniref:putative DNA modification/repair radical SAM protein n=1 Tax=uncultured Oscillibacter sp. TaxID=876091 RepID=UPI0025FCFFED|nr:putative DNA modification/repair radical SAM protein [uncultured Oscillibacter sp.]
MDVLEKLTILTDAAKYDAACTSSGGNRTAKKGYIGNTSSSVAGCCHSFSADGRCVTLLKVLLTNRCVYDCKYCVNRRSNGDIPRAAFTPEELADLTISFYRRNYIEGLFLSSGVYRSPDYTTELMIRALRLLREQHRFNGYIHAKAIPGTAPELVEQLGLLADRLSVNIELPSEAGLRALAPEKTKHAILSPMRQIQTRGRQSREELTKYRHAPKFAPAGQSTQLIVGATADSDLHILRLTQGLYDRYRLKRVFYSAYVPVVEHALLPAKDVKPPLLREHRLYQADWLLRFYGFRAEELLDEGTPDFDPRVDPKCSWALSHLDFFPVEVNTAGYETLLRVPGVGVTSAKRILSARRAGRLHIDDLRKLGVVMKRAQYFLTASGKLAEGLRFTPDSLLRGLIAAERPQLPQQELVQLSLFDPVGVPG